MGAALGSLVIISFAGSRSQQILWRKQVVIALLTERPNPSCATDVRRPPRQFTQSPFADVRPDGNF